MVGGSLLHNSKGSHANAILEGTTSPKFCARK